ncbi:diguanylate cyclase [Amycolatopsis roodepoortensis]|uniref:Diguanylate cyclase (GGDEF)-like protein n=1 Tax=Amycolatopsis roodepoortensis TaxID=700274 RepID=A0ABR9LJT2_9PSEU|nr:GGDEF domain-containing protein [Amycolatopsis roodepoortensis]MBE1580542.1 diguanylate cyclase (GGDEF)-like protein [Amycolatopsis roodepoortensis]
MWQLWSWGRRPVTWVLVVEPLVFGLIVAASVRAFSIGITGVDWLYFGWLALGATAYLIATNVAAERRRGRDGNATHVDHTSLIFFVAAILLPVPLAIALVILVRTHRWWIARKPAYKFLHTTVSICLSVVGVHAVADWTALSSWTPGQTNLAPVGLGLAAAVGVYFAAQALMVGAARGLASDLWDQPRSQRPPDWRRTLRLDMLGTLQDNLEIVVTLLIALAITCAAAAWAPLALLVAPIGVALTVFMQRHEDLLQSSTTEGRTGLLRPEAFAERAAKILDRAARSHVPTSVMLVDLDHFKKVNDTFGHLVGDQVLAAVAGELRRSARAGDELCRWGGEEMVVLLPDTDLDEAVAVAERIRAAVEVLEIPITRAAGGDPWVMGAKDADGHRRSEEVRTVSIGVATMPEHGMTLHAAMKVADDEVYRAKHGGRNRVCAPERAKTTAAA